jgi:hypothetical protein
MTTLYKIIDLSRSVAGADFILPAALKETYQALMQEELFKRLRLLKV